MLYILYLLFASIFWLFQVVVSLEDFNDDSLEVALLKSIYKGDGSDEEYEDLHDELLAYKSALASLIPSRSKPIFFFFINKSHNISTKSKLISVLF